MTHQQILEKAIQKAIDGGWKQLYIGDYAGMTHDLISGELFTVWEHKGLKTGWSVMAIIFNHNFAKALWGDEMVSSGLGVLHSTKGNEWLYPAWQHHLQQMVIADDPIKYLGDHLND